MIAFRTLGSVDLSDTNAGATFSVLGHPKRIALLTYLAAASPQGFQRRDTLLAMFWPELDTERARHALNQALYALRQDLGEAVVVSRGQEEVGIDEGALWCDVVAFRQAIEAGSWQEALDVYRGELLEGFHLDGSGEFEQWLEQQRRRLREQAAEAAWSVAEIDADEGRRTEAGKAARRAAGYAWDDELTLRRLLGFLDELGDRAGALAAYAAFAERFREDYEAEPSPETVAIVEAIRAREEAKDLPPRVDAERPDRASEGPPAAARPARSGVPKTTSASAARRRIVVGFVATATAAAAITATWITRGGSGSPERLQSFSVLPFAVTAESDGFEWLSRGAQNMLAGSLEAWQETRVVDPRILESLAEARGGRVDAETSLSQALETSAAASANTLILGDIVAQANTVEIVVRLYDVSSGRPLRDPIRVVGGADEDLRPLLDEVAASILLLSGSSGSPPDLRGATTTSLTAYRHYLTGLESFHDYELDTAVMEFDAAVAEDSTFSLALLHLARAVVGRNETSRGAHLMAQELMDRAVRHSDRLSERDRQHVHAYNAHVRNDFELARELYLELIEVDPFDRDAWYLLADVEYHDKMTVSTADGGLYPRANRNVALSGFLRSVEIDPGFHLGYGHALEILGDLDVPGFTSFQRTEPRAPYMNPESAGDLVYFYLVPRDSLFWVEVQQPSSFQEVRRQYQNDSISDFSRGRAISFARRWANSTSGSFVPYLELSKLYTYAREHSLALEATKEMIRQPTDTVLGQRFILSSRYLAAGVHDTAFAIVDRALELFHQNPPAWPIMAVENAANIFVAIGQPSRALDDILSFFPELPPMSWWIPIAGGAIDYSDSWPLIAKAQALGSSGAGGPELLATVDSIAERWAANHSGADLERLYWSQTPGLAGALLLVDGGRLEEWLSHLPDSLPEAEAAFLQPSAWRARLHLLEGSADAASAALDSALALRERWAESQRPGSHYVMGLVAQELGRDADAAELFSRIEDQRTLRRIDRMSPLWGLLTLSYLHRARSYERLGDLIRADEFYERFRRAWAQAEAPVRRYLEEAEEGIQRVRSKSSGR